MTMRSNVMIAIKDQVRSWSTTQARAARRLGITQPRLNDLLHGKINKFSLDTLPTLATRAGLKVKIDIRFSRLRPRGLRLCGAAASAWRISVRRELALCHGPRKGL